jgi:hypothetical protein
VSHLQLIIFSVGGDIPVDSETLLLTDVVNLKIKPAQSFRGTHRGRVCVRVFIRMSTRMCMSICICTVFLKNTGRVEKPTFTVPTVPPQTLATQSNREGAEARGTTHYASDRRPPTPNRDRHRHHVVLLVGSRYIYVITRL